ncbi:bacterial regulatory s, tetR family protein [Mycobacteroides abscessus subsp. bolletii 1513]|uniref:Bacterial regulatory s, tetR family protein n=1 Tax=Mycobacteroides abscessus subsp. bolletii 1513 TaxID=1299321 RepID=X8DBG1_9MYCO|nr:bacterial regulatory s, tetR family protein [Mycobacteroides abscessus subsp. bolletii 1513]
MNETVGPGEADTPRRHFGNRHGRSEAAREAVLHAADDLLVAKGYAGVTMEGIAKAAGVAKQTVYRWWSSKADVLMDVFLEDAACQLDPPDLGGLEADLRHHLSATAQFLTADDAGAVFRALIGQSQHDGQLADDFRGRYLREQQARDQIPIARAVARGELPADVDVAHVAEQLVAPLYYRVIVTGRGSTPRLLTGSSRISCAAGNNVSSIDIMVAMTETDLHDFHANVMSEIRETGRASGFFAQFDMLILHTVGAKSGQPRQNPMAYQPGEKAANSMSSPPTTGRIRALPGTTTHLPIRIESKSRSATIASGCQFVTWWGRSETGSMRGRPGSSKTSRSTNVRRLE